jgi:hypothetical protein
MGILNASPGFGTQLTEEEIKNLLGNSKLNLNNGTIDNKGDPNIHPTWYYFDATINKFYRDLQEIKKDRKFEQKEYRLLLCRRSESTVQGS